MGVFIPSNLDDIIDSTTRKAVSADEKSALAGTAGTPGDANRFVTDADTRMTDAREPDFSSFGTAAALPSGSQIPAIAGTTITMVDSSAIMSPIEWATGAGSGNEKVVDHAQYADGAANATSALNAIHATNADYATNCSEAVHAQSAYSAELADSATDADAVDGYHAAKSSASSVVVVTREDSGKIDGSFLDLSVTTATVILTNNGSGGIVISFPTGVAFPGNVNVGGSMGVTGAVNVGGSMGVTGALVLQHNIDMPVGRISCEGYAYFKSGVFGGPFVQNLSVATSAVSLFQSNQIRVNRYGTNGVACFYHFDTTNDKLYPVVNIAGTVQVQPITSVSPLTTSARGISYYGSTFAYITSSQVGAKVSVFVSTSNQTYIFDKIGDWYDPSGNKLP